MVSLFLLVFILYSFHLIFICTHTHTHKPRGMDRYSGSHTFIYIYIYKVYEILPFFSSLAYIEIVHFRLRLFAGAIGDIVAVVVMGLLLANG